MRSAAGRTNVALAPARITFTVYRSSLEGKGQPESAALRGFGEARAGPARSKGCPSFLDSLPFLKCNHRWRASGSLAFVRPPTFGGGGLGKWALRGPSEITLVTARLVISGSVFVRRGRPAGGCCTTETAFSSPAGSAAAKRGYWLQEAGV